VRCRKLDTVGSSRRSSVQRVRLRRGCVALTVQQDEA